MEDRAGGRVRRSLGLTGRCASALPGVAAGRGLDEDAGASTTPRPAWTCTRPRNFQAADFRSTAGRAELSRVAGSAPTPRSAWSSRIRCMVAVQAPFASNTLWHEPPGTEVHPVLRRATTRRLGDLSGSRLQTSVLPERRTRCPLASRRRSRCTPTTRIGEDYAGFEELFPARRERGSWTSPAWTLQGGAVLQWSVVLGRALAVGYRAPDSDWSSWAGTVPGHHLRFRTGCASGRALGLTQGLAAHRHPAC